MSKFRMRCPSCEKLLQVPEAARGKKVKCRCGTAFRVPQKAAPPRQPDDEWDDPDEFDDYEDEPKPPPRRKKGRQPGRRSQSQAPKKGSIWDFFSGKNAILKALAEHERETGDRYELVKAGIPPIRLWLSNRKGDRWGKVIDKSGHESWVRYRVRLFSSGPPLTFYG